MGNLRTQSKVTCKVFAAALIVFAVFSAQNALATAMAQSYAYYDWGSLSVSGGSLTYSAQESWYQAGYTTPNNNNDTSPLWSPNNWSDFNPGRRENPAGNVYADSMADTPIQDVVLLGTKQMPAPDTGASPPYMTSSDNPYTINDANGTTSNKQGLFALTYAKADGLTHGDIAVEQYSANATSIRTGVFSPDADGEYTFSIPYVLGQTYSVQDKGNDIATTTANFYFVLGNGTNPNDQNALDWSTFQDFSKNLRYDADLFDPYVDSAYFTGILSFTVNLLATQDYFLFAQVDNTARAGSAGFTSDHAPVPEPATILLVGSGLIGAAVSRRRRAKSVA